MVSEPVLDGPSSMISLTPIKGRLTNIGRRELDLIQSDVLCPLLSMFQVSPPPDGLSIGGMGKGRALLLRLL